MEARQVSLVFSAGLCFSCPHCGHHYEDGLELLDNDEQHDVRCEKCRQLFALLTTACPECADETTFTWPESSMTLPLSSLQCANCGMPCVSKEMADDD